MSTDPTATPSLPGLDTRKSFLAGLVGLKIADRYEVTRILGEGGMGVVAEARHTELEQRVAIKFMFPEFLSNEVLSARFAREAKLAARVQSPHIVRVSDVGRLPSGIPYLVMDLLEGRDLGDELDEKGVLSVERAVEYILQACAGIAALHALGVVHRDLKPSNLFVADVAGVSTVKVLDFGISKDVTTPAADLTSTETQLGTPMYMSPEQIKASKSVDVRSDIWSLGVILYELLTGTLPFERTGHSIGELFAVILMTDPTPLCARRPELPQPLEEVVMRCLRRSSWERWESVGAFAEALRPFARASSVHRIETVKRALGMGEPSSDLAPGEDPTVSARPAPGSGDVPAVPRTPAKTPSLELDVAYPHRVERPRAAALSPSLVSSERSIPTQPEPGGISRGVIAIVGATTLFLGAALVLAVYASSSHPTVEPPLSAAAALVPSAEPAPPQTTEPMAPVPPAEPSAAPSVTRTVPHVPAKPAPARSAASRPSSRPPSTDDLIDSRR
jgi:serine/threonine-protein kinase